jgi:acyl transferase domain-containing protein
VTEYKNKSELAPNDICIVALGCVLPQALGPEEFWQTLTKGQHRFRPIPKSRWNAEIHHKEAPYKDESTYSVIGACVDQRQISTLLKKFPEEKKRPLHRSSLYAFEAFHQVRSQLNPITQKSNVDLVIGSMFSDESHSQGDFWREKNIVEQTIFEKAPSPEEAKDASATSQKFFKEVSSPYSGKEFCFSTQTLHRLKTHFRLSGEAFFVDAACASSHAALDVAIARLKTGDSDLVITGGLESHMGPTSFVSFCSVNAMAATKSQPFDRNSEGVLVGEGAVFFALERAETALQHKHKIYAVVESIGSSSDGFSGSLFSPTTSGQLRSLQQAHAGLDLKYFEYLEGHGTGTPVGDQTELDAAQAHFEKYKLPMGSVKSLYGHLRGASGALGLLKAVMILNKMKIPAHRNIKSPAIRSSDLVLQHNEIRLKRRSEPIFVGVSSFGFGGINYHAVLKSAPSKTPRAKAPSQQAPMEPCHMIGTKAFSRSEFSSIKSNEKSWVKFRIPPKSLHQIDAAQKMALKALEVTLRETHFPLRLIDPERVLTLSASCTGLELSDHFARRLLFNELKHELKQFEWLTPQIDQLKHRYSPITEDTGHGAINNVIAARICNLLNLKGGSFNIDADFNSPAVALKTAQQQIQSGRADVAIVLACHQHLDHLAFEQVHEIQLEGIRCFLICNETALRQTAFSSLGTLSVGGLTATRSSTITQPSEKLPRNERVELT